jgi:ribose transport system permease protein
METNSVNEAAGVASAEAGLEAVKRPRPVSFARRMASRTAFWIGLIDVAAIAYFGIRNAAFLSVASFQNLGLSASELILLAIGSVYLMGAGEFDISLGANLILSSVVGGEVMLAVSGTPAEVANGIYPHLALGLALGCAACIGTGALMGLANGLVVSFLKVNCFIATLATLGIAEGIADIITNGGNLANIPTQLQTGFGSNTIAGVPSPVILTGAIVLLAAGHLYKTRFGLRTIALGSSRQASVRAGLRVRRHVVVLFTLAGGLAGIAGLIDLSRFATTDLTGHQTDALVAVAGAVIGGTALTGGVVSVAGAVIGAMLPIILQSGLVVIGLPPYYQLIAVGIILIVAVYIDQRRAREPS